MRPSVPLEINGKVYELRLTMNTVSQAETILGRPIGTILRGMAGGVSNVTDLRALLWAALKSSNKDITFDDAGDLCDQAEYLTVFNAIDKAIGLYFNGDKKNAETPTEKELDKK